MTANSYTRRNAATGETETVYMTPEQVAARTPSIEDTRTAKMADLAQKRWEVEAGGISVGGLPVPTDDKTQNRVDQIVKAYEDGDISGAIDFKAGGMWVSLNETQMRAIKAAGAAHIQACFSNEKALAMQIEAAADLAALDLIDIEQGWPG